MPDRSHLARGGRDDGAAERLRRGVAGIARHEAAVRVELVDRIERDPDKPRHVIFRAPFVM